MDPMELACVIGQSPEGGYPIGTRVVKQVLEEGDRTPIGAKGIVVGGFKHSMVIDGKEINYGYLVQFDDEQDGTIIAVVDYKLKKG